MSCSIIGKISKPASLVGVVEKPAPIVGILNVGGGSGGGAEGALLIVNRLSEFDTELKKTEARQNIGLQYIDGGTFN